MNGFYRLFLVVSTVSLFVSGAYSSILYADSFSGGSYSIDASVMNSFGGKTVSTSYSMVSSGGESIIGNGSGGSYLLGQGYTSQLHKSLQLSLQPTGLAAYYSLDELSGPTSFDWSVNNNNARNSLNNNMTWMTGKKNRAIDQAASTGYLQTSSPPLATVGEFTIEGWFYPYSTSSGMTLLAQDDASGTGDKWNVSVNGSGGLSFTAQKAGVAVSSAGTTALVNNGWRHVLVTYDGTTMRVYVNGALDSQQSNVAGSHTFTLPLTIGARDVPATPNTFDGRIDEVRVYDRAMSEAEITNHYFAQNVILNPGFVYVGDVVPGASSSVLSDAVVQTDAPGYNLSIRQFSDLVGDNYGDEIAAVAGSIATPTSWTEGTTKGFGFTLTSAPSLDSKWGTAPNYNYAAVPAAATTFYTRSGGYTGGTKDVVRMQYRLDTPSSQTADYYQNVVIISGTILP